MRIFLVFLTWLSAVFVTLSSPLLCLMQDILAQWSLKQSSLDRLWTLWYLVVDYWLSSCLAFTKCVSHCRCIVLCHIHQGPETMWRLCDDCQIIINHDGVTLDVTILMESGWDLNLSSRGSFLQLKASAEVSPPCLIQYKLWLGYPLGCVYLRPTLIDCG